MDAADVMTRQAKPRIKDTSPGDKDIQERVLAEIEKQGWSSATAVNLIVRDGIVELWGTILDERVRDAVCVATENVPEVKQIKDHLVWVDPVSGMTFDARGSVTRWR